MGHMCHNWHNHGTPGQCAIQRPGLPDCAGLSCSAGRLDGRDHAPGYLCLCLGGRGTPAGWTYPGREVERRDQTASTFLAHHGAERRLMEHVHAHGASEARWEVAGGGLLVNGDV